jgi:hypothetical protein
MKPEKLTTLARRNGTLGPMNHTDVRIGIDHVVDLLTSKTGGPLPRRAAKTLIEAMSRQHWTLVEGVHSSGSDVTPHILVEVGGARYHLRLSSKGILFEITTAGPDPRQRRVLTGGRAPFHAPGTAI